MPPSSVTCSVMSRAETRRSHDGQGDRPAKVKVHAEPADATGRIAAAQAEHTQTGEKDPGAPGQDEDQQQPPTAGERPAPPPGPETREPVMRADG
jgi:hypothetical protein